MKTNQHNPWPPAAEQRLRDFYHAGNDDTIIAQKMKRTPIAIKSRRKVLGLVKPRRYTEEEIATIKARYHQCTAKELAAELGKKVSGIHQMARRLKLEPKVEFYPASTRKQIAELHAQGLCDTDISKAMGIERRYISELRVAMGLPVNAERVLEIRRQAVKTQFRNMGIKSGGELRQVSFRRYAVKHGLPEDLRPRAVQMVYAMAQCGALTRRQIAEKIGMPWKGSRKSLVSNDPKGTYLSYLMDLGIVFCLPRVIRAGGKGHNISLYDLTLEWRERITRHVQQQANSTAGKSA